MSHVKHMNESCPTYEWVMSHIWISLVPHMHESCLMYEWVMSHVVSHIWMSYVTRMNETRHTFQWVMSCTWMRHVTHVNKSCHAYVSRIRMSHVTHRHESFHTYEWVTSHIGGIRERARGSREGSGGTFAPTWRCVSGARRSVARSRRLAPWVWSLRAGVWHMCDSHVTHINESCHTYQCVMSHISISYALSLIAQSKCMNIWMYTLPVKEK